MLATIADSVHNPGVSEDACRERSRSRSISRSRRRSRDSQVFGAHVWGELGPRLTDFQDKRLRLMDASGVEIMILSLNAPAVQAIPDVKRAIAVAREANDVLAAEIAKRPDRFAGFAALPMQDPDAAARELTRCVKELGFVGALVNGFSQAGTPTARSITTCRSTGRSGARSPSSTCRSTCIRAIRCPARSRATRPQLAARPELGVPRRDRGACAAADRLRGCSTRIRSCRSSSAISAKASRPICGASTIATTG